MVSSPGTRNPVRNQVGFHMTRHREVLLILDFGSQYTQLIARRIRENNVYSEIVPGHITWEEIEQRNPFALVLSGGPSSVFESDSPHPDRRVYDCGKPILGICYARIARRLLPI